MSVSREISLRSLLGLPAVRVFLGAAVVSGVTLAVALVLPKVFESQASVVFSVSTQQVSSQLVSLQLLSSLPAPAALAQAFTQRLETRSVSDLLGEPVPSRNYDARFEEKKGLLTLRARGSSPEKARQRADKLLAVAQGYLQERIVAAARASVASLLVQARVDLKTGEQILHDIRELLKTAPKRGGNASAAVAAGLESLKVDPSVARSANPAETFLSLQEAQLAAQVATARARTDALEGVLKDPEALSRLVGQALQVQVLAPPAEPVGAASPRPLLWTAIAFAASFSAGVLLIVIREAA